MAHRPNQTGTASNPVDFSVPFSSFETLHNANVLITGGASGIGKACAAAFLQHGCFVTIADFDELALELARKELVVVSDAEHVQAVVCNVTDWNSQLKLFKSAAGLSPTGVLNVVLPCAGPRGQVWDMSNPDLDKLDTLPPPSTSCVQVALVGHTYTCQLALWYMQAAPPDALKCLIMIGSAAAYGQMNGYGDYTAAKYGVRGSFKTLRDLRQLVGTKQNPISKPEIRVNFLAPYYVRTPLIEDLLVALQEVGHRVTPMEVLTDGVLRIAADGSIFGRAIGVAPDGCYDLRDDDGGQNGVAAMSEQNFMARSPPTQQ